MRLVGHHHHHHDSGTAMSQNVVKSQNVVSHPRGGRIFDGKNDNLKLDTATSETSMNGRWTVVSVYQQDLSQHSPNERSASIQMNACLVDLLTILLDCVVGIT